MRALYPQSARLSSDICLLAQLQLEALPYAHVQKGGRLPVIGSGSILNTIPYAVNLKDTHARCVMEGGVC